MKKLILSISIFLTAILFFNRCYYADTVWLHKCNFVYINQTDHTLMFHDRNYPYMHVILPQSSSNFIEYGDGEKETRSHEIYQNVLNYRLLYGNKSAIVSIDDTLCVEFYESGFALISNYQYELLSDRNVKYTYTFTDADFVDAKSCNDDTDEESVEQEDKNKKII